MIVLFVYLLFGVLTTLAMARLGHLKPHREDDVLAGIAMLVFWPIVVVAFGLFELMQWVIELGEPKRRR